MQVGEVQLQVNFVAQHVLTERAPKHGLDRVLSHGMDPQAVHIGVTVLAVGTLIDLEDKKKAAGGRGCKEQPQVCPTFPLHFSLSRPDEEERRPQ